jgi:hypothetical protein
VHKTRISGGKDAAFQLARWIRCLQVCRMTLVVSAMLASLQLLSQVQGKESQVQGKERLVEHPTFYRTTQIDGLSIFYREAGPTDAATLLLLHQAPRATNSARSPTVCRP